MLQLQILSLVVVVVVLDFGAQTLNQLVLKILAVEVPVLSVRRGQRLLPEVVVVDYLVQP
jgi:hypothetical protein